MSGRTLIVGDIHGCLEELKNLLEVAQFSRDDTLVSVGDLLDKGPDSAGVVRHLRLLRADGYRITLVLGNHEERHARFRRAPVSQAMAMRGAEELRNITALLSAKDIGFLETATLYHRLPEHHALVVHGGVLPRQKELPPLDPVGRSSQDRKLDHEMLRVRYVRGEERHVYQVEVVSSVRPAADTRFTPGPNGSTLGTYLPPSAPLRVTAHKVLPKGEFLPLGEQTAGDPFWANGYDGRFGTVYFGHHPFLKQASPLRFPNAVGLDLGCCFGNRLAAVALHPDGSEEVYTVPAAGRYAEPLFDDET